MPLHKHKKKKKSRKRLKRHSSLSSEDSGPWRVLLSDEDSEAPSNEEQLTLLVRKTYVNHLKEALRFNFENCSQHSDVPGSESVEEMVQKWSSALEQKALRSCMISELYRTSMVSLIKAVKTSTVDKKLYIEDSSTTSMSRLKLKVPMNKSSQTEFVNLRHEAETQTDLVTPSVLQLNLAEMSPSERPYNPAIDFDDIDSNNGGVSSSLGSNQPQSNTVKSKNHDNCNITSTSDLLDFADLPTQEYKVNVDSADSSGQKRLITECGIQSNMSITEPDKCQTTCLNHDKSDGKPENFCDEFHTGSKTFITIKKRRTSFEKTSKMNKNLDERLTELGLMVENEDDSSLQQLGKSKRLSNWFAEETAQSCNLSRILMRMTTKQREKVMKKIKDLFGDDHCSQLELSEANIAICRKRIASVVVMELTPVYQAKRIASRHLFKFLAKKITQSIMEKSLAPDTKDIRWRVKKYFDDGKVIMSEADCK
ncbi:uncharacterized protein LOC128992563 [Macrosteles quadrilineatus]|uniref:uncharacterized protein LOC128992563 n=1 Tax=Macrosteles quadrilineatus TaxID=74068 RepID=UPI0023E328EF|nr:uncharacterized protein LOC128992563 [Macrosteles quadrilineatus]